jgi:hypothetical protein
MAGTVYTASYHESGGSYGFTFGYFTVPIDDPPLHAVTGNGVFAYGATSAFPTQVFHNSNYSVDVVFAPSGPSSAVHPASNVQAVAQSSTNIELTWIGASEGNGELVHNAAAQLIFRNGVQIATVSGRTGVFVDAGLAPSTTYSYFIEGQDEARDVSVPSNTASATTTAPCATGPCSIFAPAAGPEFEALDPSSVELGVRFTADVSGTLTGIRFYKASGDDQPHTVNLWDASGTLLATASAPAVSGFGMQTVSFSTPVAIMAGTVYTASYHESGGFYGFTFGYFTVPIDDPPLHAVTGNGVFAYGATSAFPTQVFHNSNYSVDVVFTPDGP